MCPNTPHAVFMPENLICYRSHCYLTSNLQYLPIACCKVIWLFFEVLQGHIPSLSTFQSLVDLLSLCILFDGDEDLQPVFEALDIDTIHSMAFPEQSGYKIFPHHENWMHLSGKCTQPWNYGWIDLKITSRSWLEICSFCRSNSQWLLSSMRKWMWLASKGWQQQALR